MCKHFWLGQHRNETNQRPWFAHSPAASLCACQPWLQQRIWLSVPRFGLSVGGTKRGKRNIPAGSLNILEWAARRCIRWRHHWGHRREGKGERRINNVFHIWMLPYNSGWNFLILFSKPQLWWGPLWYVSSTSGMFHLPDLCILSIFPPVL